MWISLQLNIWRNLYCIYCNFATLWHLKSFQIFREFVHNLLENFSHICLKLFKNVSKNVKRFYWWTGISDINIYNLIANHIIKHCSNFKDFYNKLLCDSSEFTGEGRSYAYQNSLEKSRYSFGLFALCFLLCRQKPTNIFLFVYNLMALS